MYFAYGWPKTFGGFSSLEDRNVVFLHIDSEYCVALSNISIEIWTGGKNRVKLGELTFDAATRAQYGDIITGFWSNARHQLAVLTANKFLLFYGIRIGKDAVLHTQSPVARSAPIELKRLTIYEQYSIPIEGTEYVCPEVVADSRTIVIGVGEGELHAYSWQGKLRGVGKPLPALIGRGRSVLFPAPSAPESLITAQSLHWQGRRGSEPTLHEWAGVDSNVKIQGMHYAHSIKQIALVLEDGRVALCRVPDDGLNPIDQWSFSHWVCGPGSTASLVCISHQAQLLALGLSNGCVGLYGLHRAQAGQQLRMLSLAEWGYTEERIGPVASMQWSPDGQALAVGYSDAGCVVWSPSGCRLLCTLRQTNVLRARGMTRDKSDLLTPKHSILSGIDGQATLPLENGICALAWGPYGYQLLLAEVDHPDQIVELSFAKSLTNSHRVLHSGKHQQGRREEAVHVLQADDRLLLILEAVEALNGDVAASGLVVNHLLVPLHYIAANYPILQAAVSADGMDVAIAGRHGLALYSRSSQRWRVFGDVSQEREIRVKAIVWLPRVVVVCAHVDAVSRDTEPAAAQLLLYPRYHLDNSSLLARYPLPQMPTAMDSAGNYLLLASAPLDLTLLHVTIQGALSPTDSPTAQITVVRELSIMSVGQPLKDVALVAPQVKSISEVEPQLCALLRAGGQFSVLSMADGSEVTLSHNVECFWLPAAPVATYGDAKSPTVMPSKSHVSITRMVRPPSNESSATGELPRTASTDSLASTAQGNANSPQTGFTDVNMAGPRGSSQGNGEVAVPNTSVTSTAASPSPLSSSPFSNNTIQSTSSGTTHSSSTGHNVEMPWWTYGAAGMQLWFPSVLGPHAAPTLTPSHTIGTTTASDPELEFDKEVYPIGISFSEVAIIGVTQRTVRNMVAVDPSNPVPPQEHYPCFHPLPESQPVLPCLLRRLLQRNRFDEALALARRHSLAPHFPRSLEWLLFTTLEHDADHFQKQQSKHRRAKGSSEKLPLRSDSVPLVTAAAKLIKRFPQFPDITVRVARKTDAALWPVLFEAVGPPSGVLEVLMGRGELQSAACCLIIVDSIQGTPTAHTHALRLIKSALPAGLYDLVAELVRYLLPPGDAELILQQVHTSAVIRSERQKQLPEIKIKPQQPNSSWLSWLWTDSNRAASGSLSSGPSTTTGNNGLGDGASQPRSPHSPARPTSPRFHFDQSLAVITQAWNIIGKHAWLLLDQGCLRTLASLGHSFAHLGPGLHSLLATTMDPNATDVAAEPQIMKILSAVAISLSEFGSLNDAESVADAQLLLEVAKQLGHTLWLIAVAITLEDMQTIAEAQSRHPLMMSNLFELMTSDGQFSSKRHFISRLTSAPPESWATANGQSSDQ